MSQPLVSIVLPVRDEETFIATALDSALGQTYSNIEVIVVDDGSRDRTRAIVESRLSTEPRLRLVKESGRGVAAARNRGIAEASGEFVAPLDADDVWDPTKIERQVRRMCDGGDRCGLVYCWWVLIDQTGALLDRSPRWWFEGRASETLLEVNYIGSASIPMFRRSHVRALGGYDETFRMNGAEGAEDWDLGLRIAEMSDIGVVPFPLVAYRRRNDSMSSRVDQMWRSHALVLAAARRRRAGLSYATQRRSRAQFALHLAGVSFWAGRYAAATGWAIRGCRSRTSIAMIPHAAKLLWNDAVRRKPSVRLTINAGVRFSTWPIPEPLMPYDLVYKAGH